jgi:hypothetical protein
LVLTQGLKDLLTGRNDFLADPVAWDAGDAKGFHT